MYREAFEFVEFLWFTRLFGSQTHSRLPHRGKVSLAPVNPGTIARMENRGLRVLGVLAGTDMPTEQMMAWARSADVILAADGGADRLVANGVVPHTTIGDLDSLRSSVPQEALIRDPDQNTSDCDKLLDLAVRNGYSEITVIGVEGDRLDHVLGTLASAVRAPISVRLALRRGVGWILRDAAKVEIQTLAGELVSVLPLERSLGVSLVGVRWPLSDAELSANGLVSLSNRATSEHLSLTVRSGAVLLTVLSSRLELPHW
jgi:thiamine pyrophosphokinase